jgi:hypothetical protein
MAAAPAGTIAWMGDWNEPMGILTGSDPLWSYRHQKLTTSLEVLVDVLFLGAAAVLSFIIRLDTLHIQESYLGPMVLFTIMVVVLRPALLHVFGLYGQTWRYAGPRELLLLVAAISFGSFILAIVIFGLLLPLRVVYLFPRTVILIEWMLALMVTGGLRLSRRLVEEGQAWRQQQAAVQLLKASDYDDEVDYLASVRALHQRVAAGDLSPYGAAYDPATDGPVTYGDDSWLDLAPAYAALAHGFYNMGQYRTAFRAFGMLLDTLVLVRTRPGLVFTPAGRTLQVDVAALERGYYLSLRRLSSTGDFPGRAMEAWLRYQPLADAKPGAADASALEVPLVDAFAGDAQTLRGLAQSLERARQAPGAHAGLAVLSARISQALTYKGSATT